MRALLSDDRCYRETAAATRLGLDDDCCSDSCGEEPVSLAYPVLELRQRYRDGVNDDGNAVFAWETLAAVPSLVVEKRDEFDAEAGATRVTGTVTMPNPGTITEVPETCMLVQLVDGDDDLVWRITGSTVTPAMLVFKVERTDGGR